MMDKKLLYEYTYSIAKESGIPQKTVLEIINSYVSVLRGEIISGKEVRIFGLVSFKPSIESQKYVSTLAHHAKQVSRDTSISYYTCLNVIGLYIKKIQEDILQGKGASIRGIVTFIVVKNESVTDSIYSNISQTIRKELESKSVESFTVRAHTSKLIKHKMSEATV